MCPITQMWIEVIFRLISEQKSSEMSSSGSADDEDKRSPIKTSKNGANGRENRSREEREVNGTATGIAADRGASTSLPVN